MNFPSLHGRIAPQKASARFRLYCLRNAAGASSGKPQADREGPDQPGRGTSRDPVFERPLWTRRRAQVAPERVKKGDGIHLPEPV